MVQRFVFAIALVLAQTCLFVHAGRPQYSVGFDFSLDYAVASINFANGTFVDVARVQGTYAYRQAMRDAASSYFQQNQSTWELEWTQRSHEVFEQENASFEREHRQHPLILSARSLCDYLPSCLDFPIAGLDLTAQAFAPMLQSLKIAVEMHLGKPGFLNAVGVSLPFRLTTAYHHSLHSAASSISLSLFEPRFAGIPAGIYAATRYEGLTGRCDDWEFETGCDPNQLILAIDYSKAAMTAMLLLEDLGIFEILRTLHDEAFGTTALDSACQLPDTHRECTADLHQALIELTQPPLPEGSPGGKISSISHVVLHGEAAKDSRLDMVLREVLRRQETPSLNNREHHAVDPLFAAARGIAKAGWLFIDEPPPVGCNCNDYARHRPCW